MGILPTTVYICGLTFRPKRRLLGMELDSFVILLLYAVAIAGLVAIATSSPPEG